MVSLLSQLIIITTLNFIFRNCLHQVFKIISVIAIRLSGPVKNLASGILAQLLMVHLSSRIEIDSL